MFKMVSRHHNQVFTNQRMLNQGKSTRFARSYKVTIVGEDKGEGRHTGSLHSLCCRGRSCSSRTSRSPPHSCSSRTPCSTPGRGRGLNPCSQCERYTCCRPTLSLVEHPRPVIPPSGEKHTAKHKFRDREIIST